MAAIRLHRVRCPSGRSGVQTESFRLFNFNLLGTHDVLNAGGGGILSEVREWGTAVASIKSRFLSPPVWLSHSSVMRRRMVSLAFRMVPVCPSPFVDWRRAADSPERVCWAP